MIISLPWFLLERLQSRKPSLESVINYANACIGPREHPLNLRQIDRMPPIPALGHRRLRQGRCSLPGQLYLLTTVTWRRRPYFLDPQLSRLAARALSRAEHWYPSRCLSWVLMPDHWHGLVELGDDLSLATTMQRIKGMSARQVGLQYPNLRPLWAKGFHDHALRDEESIHQVSRYIVANPLRAGLVTDLMDYPYWDASFLDAPPDLQTLS